MKSHKYNIRATSIEAFKQVRISHDEALVYDAIKILEANQGRGVTDHEVKAWLNHYTNRVWEINQVTGRRNGLLGKGLVDDSGKAQVVKMANKRTTRMQWKTVDLEWEQPFEAPVEEMKMEVAL